MDLLCIGFRPGVDEMLTELSSDYSTPVPDDGLLNGINYDELKQRANKGVQSFY